MFAANDPISIFRASVGTAIRDIETHPRGELFQRFLRSGPYWAAGDIPPADADKCLGDDECALATAFIYYYMVNSFQGCLAELLAAAPCARLLKELQRKGRCSGNFRLYAGNTVRVRPPAKGPDLYILAERGGAARSRSVTVGGLVEIKSYHPSPAHLRIQLDRHRATVTAGLQVGDRVYAAESIRVPSRPHGSLVRVLVTPARWRLPRSFRFVETPEGKFLRTEPGLPQADADVIEDFGAADWRVTLKWSKEALAAAAYELTFWYMAKVGEVIYSAGFPAEWPKMTPAEAGRNAAKMMLYYAILRIRTWQENQRAVALYNAYGFGYALGTSFKNLKGSREMLWFEDLHEILEKGVTKHGCRLVP